MDALEFLAMRCVKSGRLRKAEEHCNMLLDLGMCRLVAHDLVLFSSGLQAIAKNVKFRRYSVTCSRN